MLDSATGPSVTSVGIRPNSSILSVLSHLNYKAWFAVAEFVDNSIQSFFSSREQLRALHGDGFKLKIRVWLDQQNRVIEVTDNATGIRAVDFPRAFRSAEIPTDRTGLSEFGMGMKTAACWFTHTWNVRTKALGEPVERLIRFNLNDIVSAQLESLPVLETPAGANEHYTVVRLENLGKKFPVKRTQKKSCATTWLAFIAFTYVLVKSNSISTRKLRRCNTKHQQCFLYLPRLRPMHYRLHGVRKFLSMLVRLVALLDSLRLGKKDRLRTQASLYFAVTDSS